MLRNAPTGSCCGEDPEKATASRKEARAERGDPGGDATGGLIGSGGRGSGRAIGRAREDRQCSGAGGHLLPQRVNESPVIFRCHQTPPAAYSLLLPGSRSLFSAYPSYAPPACLEGDLLLYRARQFQMQILSTISFPGLESIHLRNGPLQ